jgi:PAS domain S-box-containing protein
MEAQDAADPERPAEQPDDSVCPAPLAPGSWEWNPETDRFLFSDQMCRLLGIDPARPAPDGQDLWRSIHADDRERTRATLLRAIEGGEVFLHEYRVLLPDGRQRILQSRGQAMRGPETRGTLVVGSCRDVTELCGPVAWSEPSASLLRATLEATADGILVVDRDGGVITYNQRFLEMWRIPPEVARRSRNDDLLAFVRHQVCDQAAFLELARQSQIHPDREFFMALRFHDGRVFERFSSPQRVGDQIIGRVLTFRDVTERERLLDQAQEAVRLRDEFLSIAAHEIRGPITSMRLAVQSLRAVGLPPEALPQSLEIIDRSERRLANFIEKLLDLGRIQTGALQFDLEPVDLAEVAREAVCRHDGELQRSGSTLHLRAESSVIGCWDRVRLDQIVTNLLHNAIKFGRGKPIELEVGASQGRAFLVVRDQGIGIAPAIQQRIFQPFQRGVSIRHYGGLGLGLHIVQTIVEGLGGRVGVVSEPGQGSTFRVELPQNRPA